MAYIEGFVTPVRSEDRDRFTTFITQAAVLFRDFGATRVIDAWGDDLPAGKVNDFKTAVQAGPDETVGFGWIEYPDKATRDAASDRMMSDPRMADLGDMPFDGQRMIFGGFDVMVDHGESGALGYVDGFIIPVPEAKKDAYRAMADMAAPVFTEHGATRVVEGWGDDVPKGKVTDYHRAALAEEGERVVFSWIEWPDKATRDAGMKAVMEDERMKTPPDSMPFDGKRMIFGGFVLINEG